MDYKYINQLLERYWRCETSLEEEGILRAFFSQEELPQELRPYKPLFAYEAEQAKSERLSDDFDARILSMVEGAPKVVARRVTLAMRMKPLFKAAAVVAVILTLGNAMQVPFERNQGNNLSRYTGYDRPEQLKENSVAMSDSTTKDTLRHSMVEPTNVSGAPIIK